MTTFMLSLLPNSVGPYFAAGVLVIAIILLYALYAKGDVRAVFSHGKTVLELEAKERHLPDK
jgi:uncharacterized membrane protein YobD (UPF0266 family)